MGAIVLDLRPGLGIGPFTLGNLPTISIYYALHLIIL